MGGRCLSSDTPQEWCKPPVLRPGYPPDSTSSAAHKGSRSYALPVTESTAWPGSEEVNRCSFPLSVCRPRAERYWRRPSARPLLAADNRWYHPAVLIDTLLGKPAVPPKGLAVAPYLVSAAYRWPTACQFTTFQKAAM